MQQTLCSRCLKSFPSADLATVNDRCVCAGCLDLERQVPASAREHPLSRIARPPRRATKELLREFLRRGRMFRVSFTIIGWGFAAFLIPMGLFMVQHLSTPWRATTATIEPPEGTDIQTVAIRFTAPDGKEVRFEKKMPAEEAARIAKQADGRVNIAHQFDRAVIVELQGRSIAEQINSLRDMAYAIVGGIAAIISLCWVGTRFVRRVNLGQVHIFEYGRIAAAESAHRKVATAFGIPAREGWVVKVADWKSPQFLPLPMRQEAWCIDGMPVICFLPDNHRKAMLITQRMSLLMGL